MQLLNDAALDRPIRVVLFGGGPTLELGVRRFICRLEGHADIDFLAGFCQARSTSFGAIVRDLWKRRRFMILPLLAARFLALAGRWLASPRENLALKRGLSRIANRIQFVPDIHAANVLNSVRSLSPDLGLIYGSPILKPQLFEIPRLGTLGIHHGKLPHYRGKKTTFWAMLNGEESAGVTIQKVNAGLDTGEIVKEGEVPISGRSVRRVWRELETLGLDLYLQAVLDARAATAVCTPNPGPKGKLYRDPKLRDILRLHWQRFTRARRS